MLLKEASQISSGLSRQVVKVESMSDSVHNWKYFRLLQILRYKLSCIIYNHTCEKDAPPGSVLMKTENRIERNVMMNGSLSKPCSDVPTCREQQDGKAEHHCGGGSSSDGYSPAGNLTESYVLFFDSVSYKKSVIRIIDRCLFMLINLNTVSPFSKNSQDGNGEESHPEGF